MPELRNQPCFNGATTLSITTLSITTLSITANKSDPEHNDTQHNGSVVMLSVNYAECHECLVSQSSTWR
jgi:hypothetical protein